MNFMDILTFLYKMDIIGFMKVIVFLGSNFMSLCHKDFKKILSFIICTYTAIIFGSIIKFIQMNGKRGKNEEEKNSYIN